MAQRARPCSHSERRCRRSRSPTPPPARPFRLERRPGCEGHAGDVHLQPLPVREARHARAGPARARLRAQGIGIVAINSNDVEAYPQDGPDAMKELATSEGWTFRSCWTTTQDVAAGVSGRVHARLLPVRRRGNARLPRPSRREPPQSSRADGPGPARRARRPDRGWCAGVRTSSQHRMQHQVEGGEGAGPARVSRQDAVRGGSHARKRSDRLTADRSRGASCRIAISRAVRQANRVGRS